MGKPKSVTRICRHHGESVYILEGRGFYRCRRCRVDGVANRRRALRLKAVAYKGGKCQRCGYSRSLAALELHHRDGDDKLFDATGGQTRSWERVKAEADKCDLLCANCHRELHSPDP